MLINFENELTFIINEKTLSSMIKCIAKGNFEINNVKYTVKNVNISQAIHFYFLENNMKKNIYKFKYWQGLFIFNDTVKLPIQHDNSIVNIEMVNKHEYLENADLNFNDVSSIIYKEKMSISFTKNDFKIIFDRISAVDPLYIKPVTQPLYYVEIEKRNNNVSFDEIINKFNLSHITESKYVIGKVKEKVDIHKLIMSQGISYYLNKINTELNSYYFEKFRLKYYFYDENVELEVKIKDPCETVRECLINELEGCFTVLHGHNHIFEDEYYDYNNILLINNLSYRIRKTHRNLRRNMVLKIPSKDRSIFSSRIEYMNKFCGYKSNEIVNCECEVNNTLNNYFDCLLSSRLEKVADMETSRDTIYVLNKGEPPYLIGVMFYDKSKLVCRNTGKISSFSELEFEIDNDFITQDNFNENFMKLSEVFVKHNIDNSNKYLYAIKKLFLDCIPQFWEDVSNMLLTQ